MAECIRFFRVLLPDFSTRMPLPVEFGVRLLLDVANNEHCAHASLVNSMSGHAWEVDVFRDGSKVYLGGERWYDFTLANQLRVGYFLVFHYRGSMFFTFRVFDLSTCEKVTSPTPPIFQLERLSMAAYNDNQVMELIHPPNMRKGKEKVGTSARCYYQIKDNPRFETIMTAKNITKEHVHLHVPAKFRDDIGLSVDKTELIILDPKGRSWNIGCYHRNRFQTGYAFRETTFIRGWSKFVRENELRVGDRCTFELVTKDQGGLITIRMLPACRSC